LSCWDAGQHGANPGNLGRVATLTTQWSKSKSHETGHYLAMWNIDRENIYAFMLRYEINRTLYTGQEEREHQK